MPVSPREKLPVYQILVDSLTLMHTQARLVLTITLPAAVMLLGATAAEVLGTSDFVQDVFYVLGLWLGTGATVQHLRLGAFGPQGIADPANDPFRIGRREVGVFLTMLAVLGIPLGFTAAVAPLAGTGNTVISLGLLVIAPVLLLLGVRLFLIMAAWATESPRPVHSGWQCGEGSSWRLAGVALAVTVIFLIPLTVLIAFAAGLAAGTGGGETAATVETLIARGLITLWQLTLTAYANICWGMAFRFLAGQRPRQVDTQA